MRDEKAPEYIPRKRRQPPGTSSLAQGIVRPHPGVERERFGVERREAAAPAYTDVPPAIKVDL